MFSAGEPFENLARLNAARGGYGGARSVEERVAERMAKARTFAPFKEDQQIFDGSHVEVYGHPVPGGGYVITYTDITARTKAEAELVKARDELERRVNARTIELRQSEEKFRNFAEASADWFWETDAEHEFVYVSDNYQLMTGKDPALVYGKTHADFYKGLSNENEIDEIFQKLDVRGAFRNVDFVYDRDDDGDNWLRVSGTPIFTDDGGFKGYRGTGTEITKLKRNEERLRDSEAKLQQAQKMEAVGQLTGGVAHDFNNLLMIIMGNAELLQDRLEDDREPLDAVFRATRRGAELTQRLLAFSRQQPLQPQAIDLGALASGMSGLLTRSLGATIEVRTSATADLWDATADPGQVENALLNLAINARDAMPGGGKLTIECENARLEDADTAQDAEAVAGDYVVLAVSDNGTGMPAEVRAQAFEPFFTTKEVGEGSGLGLSMVYGFAKQSGGHASIYSENGDGTTVKIYLPRAERVAEQEDKDPRRDMPQGDGETILLIEDDPDVRDLAVRMLEALGYRTVAVGDAAAAEKTLSDGQAVDLVLSDVVLPGGTSGPEFAEQARTTHPDLKIIFMSGYPAESTKRNGILGSDKVLLNKPFQRQQLAKALREALR